jgi:Zn-dependent protease
MLFVSVLIHELGHSAVAMHYGLSVPRITLFLFGGVSQIADEPPSATAEFWISIVGPLVSFALAALFWELQPAVARVTPLLALFEYLALLNLILGAFNLIPGFPLDGGRVLRAILWKVTGNFHRASVNSAITGRFFGFLFILVGVWQALGGNFFGGLWIAFIGWFLESAAASEAQQETTRNLLARHTVREAMDHNFTHIPESTSLQEVVDRYVLSGGVRCFVVDHGEQTAGLLTLSDIRHVPRPEWPERHAADVMVPFEKLSATTPTAQMWTAVAKMGRDGVNQLPVVESNGIVGMLSRDDVLHYLRTLQSLAA